MEQSKHLPRQWIPAFKNVVSTGAHIVEVKGSAMQFDSRLVIVVSNTDPESLANTAGLWARDAIFDRLIGSRSILKGSRNKFEARETLKNKLISVCCDVLSRIGINIFRADVEVKMDDAILID